MRSRWGCVVSVMVVLSQVLSAQVVQVRPIDIEGGIKNGSIRTTISPMITSDTLKAFDGNPFTFLTSVRQDSVLAITLEWDTPIQFEKTKVYFFTNGSWSFEAANSISDLNTRTGSYVRLVEPRRYSSSAWDSASFTQTTARIVRLLAVDPVDSVFLLGEWTLERSVRFTSLLLMPRPVKLLPGTSLKVRVLLRDEQGAMHENFLADHIVWRSSNTGIATVDEDGKVTGTAIGSTAVSASITGRGLSGHVPVDVLTDFRSEKVKPMNIKVALVLQDPAIPSKGYRRIHEIQGWRDPVELSNRLVALFREATDSVVNFQIVETISDGPLFTRYYGEFMTATQYDALLSESNWQSLKDAHNAGKIAFDYREFVKSHRCDEKRNNGQIDEVWVFAGPYLGMYESQLMGPNAFWWNSPPIKDGTALTKLLSVMGLNYERGVDQAFHSFGHRTESAISQAYYQAQGRNWNDTSSHPTPWDLFTRIDKRMPGQAHVGNIHFPPNGASDYDYYNTVAVKSFAENWYRYPYLLDRSSMVNADTWRYAPADPLAETQEHLGYLRWWYDHLPRYAGVTDGVLNNWWHYVVDYEAAVELAKVTPVVGVNDRTGADRPVSYSLEQNFPNPFNPITTIQFNLPKPGQVSLRVFDVMGREVATLAEGSFRPGRYEAHWNAQSAASGVYFYRLQSKDYVETKPMVLIK
ncbi:MAG: T9SS type A sorting domain-containing protein [Ignavibacteria bacterium]|nr:T9SS type A sorting domain-containing protein [Ignavibacteria bacterium]